MPWWLVGARRQETEANVVRVPTFLRVMKAIEPPDDIAHDGHSVSLGKLAQIRARECLQPPRHAGREPRRPRVEGNLAHLETGALQATALRCH